MLAYILAGSLVAGSSVDSYVHPHLSTLDTHYQAAEDYMLGGNTKALKNHMERAESAFRDVEALNLPSSVSSLLLDAEKGKGDVVLDEASITKARGVLNGLIVAAQKELDEKTLECKEFHQRNRELSRQIKTDLARLAEQITNQKGLEAESNAGIADSDAAIGVLEEEMAEEEQIYGKIRQTRDEEMSWRQNDLRVAEFILRLTKCKASFLEASAEVRHCEDENGETARFENSQIHMASLSMREEGRRALEQALLESKEEVTLAKPREEKVILGVPSQGKSKPASKRKQANKCTTGKPNCGLLHDNMSLMWGEMKDEVDKLTAKMRKEKNSYDKKVENWNQQIQMYSSAKSTHGQSLAEASSNLAADGEEQIKKEAEDRHTEKEFNKVWGECKAAIKEILFTKICGVRQVRGELHKKSEKVKPTDIIDCDVGDWIESECSVPCDDNKPAVGGLKTLRREVVQKTNGNGTECPSLEEQIKCGQFPCPVNCLQSEFESWSSCSKDCGGGIQTRSRTIMVKAKNGGTFCDAPSESNICNSGSCDRACDLTDWKHRPCSVACGGGYEVRRKHVKRRARANGKCPNKKNKERYGKKKCNQHQCAGDEECVAKQDVIVALDGSGSLTEKGFDTLKEFTQGIVKQFRGEVDEPDPDFIPKKAKKGEEPEQAPLVKGTAVQVGVIQFGNGVLADDGTVSAAEIISPLSNDLEGVDKAIGGLTWQKGFTNMAQAFTASESVFMNGGRKNAQSVLLVITDGKPSFKFQTINAVEKLRRKGVKVVIVAVKNFLKPPEEHLLKKFASKPSKTHFLHVPGLKQLRHPDFQHEQINKVLIHSCPKTVSLKREKEAKERAEAIAAVEDLGKSMK